MNLVKWLRKNNTKIMAVVVIVLMIGFIGGSSLTYILRGSGGAGKAVAYFGNKQKITYRDRAVASEEIEILTALGADRIMASQDLPGVLLGDLLFSQNRGGAGTLDMIRQTVQRNRLRISDEQLSELYRGRTMPGDMYWILLREEAAAAGMHWQTDEVGVLLARLIPQLFEGRSYAQVMQSLVSRFNTPEPRILATFGKLLSVLQYTQAICSMENVTASQVRHIASWEMERLDTEFVRLEASAFADKAQAPAEAAMTEQFNRYKAYFPGDVNEANPFGFGYRLPTRVQLEYIALKLEDVASVVKPPTQNETEQYYQQNRQRMFTEQVPADPNDPNSPMVPKTKTYAEVADTIRDQLRRQKINTRAEQILQEARTLADADLQPTDSEEKELSLAERANKAGSYQRIAQDLSANHGVRLYSGRTGLLSAVDMQTDEFLGRMFLTTYGHSPIRLSQVAFSVKELGDDATLLLSMAPAEMYASIGPARDPMAAMGPTVSDQIMIIVRVIDAQRDAVPANLDVAYSTRGLSLGDTPEEPVKAFSMSEKVAEDLRTLAAWDTTGDKAKEFATLATKDGWDQAVAQFNQLYGEQAKADPNDPNVFALDQLNDLQRISDADLQVLATQVANNPAAAGVLNEMRVQRRFVERLYALAPAGSGTLQAPEIMEFKPSKSYYILRSISVQQLNQEDFQRMKGMILSREEYSQAQNLAVVHLNPENILKRMNFRLARQADEPDAGRTADGAEEAS